MSTHVEGRFTGSGGLQIYWQSWTPDAPARAVAVISHGVSEHSGRYAHVAHRLAEAGYAVFAIDHRGHGRSEGVPGNINRMSEVLDDLSTLIDLAVGSAADLPIFLIGHSLGGLIALDYVTDRKEHSAVLSGLVLSGAAIDISIASPLQRRLAGLLSAIAPNLGVVSLDADAISRDPAVVADYDSDPLNYRGKIRARTGAEGLAAVGRVTDRLRTVELPVLVMHGTEDRLAAVDGAHIVVDGVGSTDVTPKIYRGLAHEVFNEPEKDAVLDDLVEWLDTHSSGRQV